MKQITLILMLLALLITSCQGNSSTRPPETEIASQSSSEPKSAATAKSSPETKVASTATQAIKEPASVPAGCTVISPRPTPGPTEQSIFPPVRESDWVYGSDEAAITIIEYSDFQ